MSRLAFVAFLTFALVAKSLAAASLEFSAYLDDGHDQFFSLFDPDAKATSGWLRLEGTFHGYELVAYDKTQEVLTLRSDAGSLKLKLKSSIVEDGPAIPVPPPIDLQAQLRVEEEALAKMRLRYTERHPAVRSQLHRIELLQAPLRPGESPEERVAEVHLAELKERFPESHPLVQRQEALLAAIRAQHK